MVACYGVRPGGMFLNIFVADRIASIGGLSMAVCVLMPDRLINTHKCCLALEPSALDLNNCRQTRQISSPLPIIRTAVRVKVNLDANPR